MKNIYFKSKDGFFWVNRNNIDDVFDLKRFPYAKIPSFAEFLGVNTEREGKQIAKNMFKDLMKEIAYDMIKENVIFAFPYPKFGYMKVSDMHHEKGAFDIQAGGRNYKPRISLDPEIRKENKKAYVVRFTRENYKILREQIDAGHRY